MSIYLNVYTQLVRCVADTLFAVWFFRAVRPQGGTTRRGAALVLLATMPIYVISGSGAALDVTLRFAYRAAVYMVYLRLAKGLPADRCGYFAVLCWVAFTAENNIFLTPQLSALRWNQIAYTPNPAVNNVISQLAEYLLEFFILTLVSRLYPFNDMRRVGRVRWGVMAVTVLCELYIKLTLRLMSERAAEYPPELTVYPILLQILLMIAVVLLERYLHHRMLAEKQRLSAVANDYRYQSAQAKAQADSDLRRLHHDLKNHLLAIRALARENRGVDDYVERMMQSIEQYGDLARTGNPILDGLLSEKLHQARKAGVDLNVCIDFRQGSFVQDIDICAIFGNALDNALEASCRVADPARRSILVKCGAVGQNLVLTFMNYYEGELTPAPRWFESAKGQPHHGIGLSSIQQAAESYGGVVTARTDEFHNFILTVLLPLPEPTGEKEEPEEEKPTK